LAFDEQNHRIKTPEISRICYKIVVCRNILKHVLAFDDPKKKKNLITWALFIGKNNLLRKKLGFTIEKKKKKKLKDSNLFFGLT
jgi:hypothetical protein